jgi:hypothetical protein
MESLVSGDPREPVSDLVLLEDDPVGHVEHYIRTLSRLPSDPRWILIGGLGVNVRIERIHRATNDVDAVTHDQRRLVEILLLLPETESLSAAKVQFHDPDVEVDVMASTEGAELPIRDADRAFALARRFAMRTASPVRICAVSPSTGLIVESVTIEVASRAALIALKTISFPERKDGSYPEKVGSDIQDLYRLVAGQNLDSLVELISEGGQELSTFVGGTLSKNFTLGSSDLRYGVARLRRLARNIDASTIGEQELSLLGELGAALE